jgi:uncharacterized protein (TIGR00369 family)
MPDLPDDTHLAQLTAAFEGLPHCRELGMKIVSLQARRAVMKLDYSDRLIGNPQTGVIHGGVISTVIDTAAGLAASSSVPVISAVATLDMRIDYLKPALPGKAVIAEAECYQLTKSVAFVRALAHQGDRDEPVAHCVATFMLNSAGFSVTDSLKA